MIKKILVAVVVIVVLLIGLVVWAFSGRDPLQFFFIQYATVSGSTS